MEFLKDDGWKKKHTNKEIYLMVNHKWAFVVWEIGKLHKTINENALLVHVDSHLDDVPELVEDGRYFVAKSEQNFMELGEYKRSEEDVENHNTNYELRMDNFVIPAFLRDTIKDIIYVSDQDLEEIRVEDFYHAASGTSNHYDNKSGNTNEYTLKKCYEKIQDKGKTIQRFFTVEEYLNAVESLPIEQSKILDLDLDYFNDSNNIFEPNLKSDVVIRDNLIQLKEHCDWDIITVALSPLYCGGEEECLHILNIFLEVFELDTRDFMDW